MVMEQRTWIRALGADEVSADKPRTIKHQGKQIAIFRVGADTLQAIDNRCPHEGYPLSTGALADGVLTCEWHNWKFSLCDGACILGGEDVRHYPLRVDQDGQVWLDITDPPAQAQRPALYASLAAAFDDDDWGWAARTSERLLALGAAPAEILGFACDFVAARAPYGFEHGLAAAADLAGIMARTPEADDADESGGVLVPLLEAMNLMVQPNLRRPMRQLGQAENVDVAPSAAPAWHQLAQEFGRRVEAEELAGAEGLLRGAVAAGASPEQLFGWLTEAATAHFLGYGHSHIYCVKAEELLGRIGWQHAHPVLTSLVSAMVYDTREDKLPYMREYRKLVAEYAPRLDGWARARGADERADACADACADAFGQLIATTLDGSLADSLAALARGLDAGVPGERLALALGVAAGHRLLRFAARLEHDDAISEGWLHITHALTHADAVRETALRRPSRAALVGLMHSARFIQHLAVCDDPERDPAAHPWSAERRDPEPAAFSAAAFERALREYRAADAMALARGACADAAGRAALAAALDRVVLADRATAPIFVVHHIKTTMAALRLTWAVLDDPVLTRRPDALAPLLGAVRFLAHPLAERRVARNAKVARAFVRHGRMQEKLLGY